MKGLCYCLLLVGQAPPCTWSSVANLVGCKTFNIPGLDLTVSEAYTGIQLFGIEHFQCWSIEEQGTNPLFCTRTAEYKYVYMPSNSFAWLKVINFKQLRKLLRMPEAARKKTARGKKSWQFFMHTSLYWGNIKNEPGDAGIRHCTWM